MCGQQAAKRSSASLRAEAVFRQRLAEVGAVLLEAEWLGATKPHRVRCTAGHECHPYPTNLNRGIGPCRTCAGKDPVSAEAEFRRRLADLGAEPLYDKWLGANKPHQVRCAAGHDCRPTPSRVQQGGGACRRCGSVQLDRAPARKTDARFRAALAGLGATPGYETWAGRRTPHRVLCSAGHECWPKPDDVLKGGGVCRTCAGGARRRSDSAFLQRLEELGAKPLFDVYTDRHLPHEVLCPAGHTCYPRPHDVLRGRGICRICAGRDPVTAEAEFRGRLVAIGATPVYETYLGAQQKHHVICAAGHDCWTRPTSVQRGDGICSTCAGNDTLAAETAFRARVTELGGTPLYRQWRGVLTGHLVRCPRGHESAPRPSGVSRGGGICSTCAGRIWDAFYVVSAPLAVKFGITSGNPRPRLTDHARDGFTTVIRCRTALPEKVAEQAERAVLSALALAKEAPLKGKEYFDISCLALILDVADSYLPVEV